VAGVSAVFSSEIQLLLGQGMAFKNAFKKLKEFEQLNVKFTRGPDMVLVIYLDNRLVSEEHSPLFNKLSHSL